MFISAGTLDTPLFQSMKNGFVFLRRKHFFFILLYGIFAVAWLLNFIPLLQLATIFAVYPILYSAMIIMFLNMGETKIKRKGE
jgi:hypothetical protein